MGMGVVDTVYHVDFMDKVAINGIEVDTVFHIVFMDIVAISSKTQPKTLRN